MATITAERAETAKTARAIAAQRYPTLCYREIIAVAIETFRANKVRFALTALGMVIGTASLILVVTIGLTGKQYVLQQIQAVGANMIYVEYEGGGQRITATPADFLTVDDMIAVDHQALGMRAASPMVQLHDRIPAGEGKERDVMILGVAPDYRFIRNLDILAGRFFDEQDTQARNKVLIVQQQLATALYGSQ